jgi:hypothetical protein
LDGLTRVHQIASFFPFTRLLNAALKIMSAQPSSIAEAPAARRRRQASRHGFCGSRVRNRAFVDSLANDGKTCYYGIANDGKENFLKALGSW